MGGESIGYLYKGFFPFDGEDDSNADYNFGMNFTVDFTLTADGKLNGDDMVFDFAGDDDVWVYVDGKLVLDIGGIHDRLTASIDFASQTAVVNDSEGNATSSENFSSELLEAMNYDTADGYDGDTVHTLSVFYLERGQAESNAYISFNLIPTNTVSVVKEVSDELLAELTTELGSKTAAEAVEYPFHVEKYDATTGTWSNVLESVDYTFTTASGKVSTATTDENGAFKLKNGEEALFVIAKVGLENGDIIRAVEDTTSDVTTSFDTSWEIEDVTSGESSTNSGLTSAFKTIDLSEESGIVSVAIDNASFNDTVMGTWSTTFEDATSVETGVTYDFTDAETSDDNDNEGRNYYFEVANNSDDAVTGSLYRTVSIDNSNTGYTGEYDVSIQVKSSTVGDTGLTLDANGVSTSIESYATDSWETYTVQGVSPDENNEIIVTISGTVAAGVTVGIDDLRVEADESGDTSGSSYEFLCYNTILDVIEYFVELSKSTKLVVGEDIDGVSEYTVSGISIKSDSEKAGKTYTASLSDSTSSGNADANLTLTYKQTGSTGDYTYTMTYDSDSDGTIDANVATVVIHVYATKDDVYVLDYGLATDLADTTYDNGLFENDKLNTGAETKAQYDGMKVKDSTDSYTTDTVTGVEGTVTTDATSNSISVNVATNSNTFAGKILYTPTEFMSELDEFTYEVKVMKSSVAESDFVENKNGVTMDANIKVMPANIVYYEDNFASSGTDNTDSTKGIIYSTTDDGSFATEGTTSTEQQGNGLKTNYGYDSAYADDLTASNGSTTVMTAGTSYGTTAEFTFKGTGFDIVSRANINTTTILVEVTNSSGTLVKWAIVNTFYQSGDLYQIPVIKISGLDYAEYTATIYVVSTGYQSTFYLDGIRIYNPAGTNTDITSNYSKTETNASIAEVKSLILGKGFYTTRTYTDADDTEGTNVLVAGSGVAATLVTVSSDGSSVTTGTGSSSMYVETFNDIKDTTVTEATTTSDYYEYLMKGPNNEIYIAKDSAVAFTVEGYSKLSSSSTFQVAAKAVSGATSMNILVIDTDGNILSTKSVDVASATELYYNVELPSSAANGAIILVQNSDSAILSLTDIKYKGITLKTVDTEATEDFTTYLTEITSTVYTVYVGIGIISGNTEEGYGDGDEEESKDATELANTVKAQVSAVSDGKYSLRFIGGTDSVNYNALGFTIAVYDADGNVLKEESKKSVSKVYSSIKVSGNSLTPDEVYGSGSGINYFYTYTYSNIPTSGEYYFAVANYTTTYDSDGKKVQTVSGYKYYYVTNGTVSVVDAIPTAE
jgi:fibro-slime domain-containing protein